MQCMPMVFCMQVTQGMHTSGVLSGCCCRDFPMHPCKKLSEYKLQSRLTMLQMGAWEVLSNNLQVVHRLYLAFDGSWTCHIQGSSVYLTSKCYHPCLAQTVYGLCCSWPLTPIEHQCGAGVPQALSELCCGALCRRPGLLCTAE